MKYIVVCKDHVFYTDWFQKENHWCDDIVCIMDMYNETVTYDGENWECIDFDHL